MIKFIEKIFSGLAYQIGKFLFFVLLAIAICFLVDKEKLFDIIDWRVDASSIRNITLDNLQSPVFFYPFNCTSPSSCSSDSFNVAYDTYNKNTFYYTDSGTSIHNSGVYINYKLNSVLQPGYLYSISTYICSNTNNLLPYKSFTGIGATSYGGTMAYSSKTYGYYSANQVEFSMYPPNSTTGENGYITMQDFNNWFTPLQVNQCGIYYDVFSPGTTSTWYGLQLTRETNANNVNFLLAGYKLTELGIYSASLSSDITNTINTTITNTSQATQEQINELNQEIQEMTSEQQQTNEKLDNINGTLTDTDTSQDTGDDFFDSSSINTSDGVVSGLITLPIQMASKLVDNLGGSCSPYKMNFGMLGKSYTLNFPCIDIEDYLGADLWHIIDLLFCGFMAYNIAMLFVSIYDSITSLQDYYYSYIYQSSHEEHTRENRRARTPSE